MRRLITGTTGKGAARRYFAREKGCASYGSGENAEEAARDLALQLGYWVKKNARGLERVRMILGDKSLDRAEKLAEIAEAVDFIPVHVVKKGYAGEVPQ